MIAGAPTFYIVKLEAAKTWTMYGQLIIGCYEMIKV